MHDIGDPLAVEVHTLRPIPLRTTAATGFIGAVCILIGVAQTGSPFASKLPDAWFFGLPNGASGVRQNGTFLGIMCVYLGVALLVGSWFEVVRTLRRHGGTSVRTVVSIIVAWSIPILVMPPLFSRDVYSYVAQGEMLSRGLNPYVEGPAALGGNASLRLVDPIWRTAHAPYGPAWERVAEGIVRLARHDVIAAVIGFRVVALVGIALIAWGVIVLARSVGHDASSALALAVLNPLVLLVLLGGAHNDALMLGLLVAGCAAARRNHYLIGLLLCALAAEVKIPALTGALFIGWWWSGESAMAATAHSGCWRPTDHVGPDDGDRPGLGARVALARRTEQPRCGGVLGGPGHRGRPLAQPSLGGVGVRHALGDIRPGGPCDRSRCRRRHLGRIGSAFRKDRGSAGARLEPSRLCRSGSGDMALVRDVGIRVSRCDSGGLDLATPAGAVSDRLLRRPPGCPLL